MEYTTLGDTGVEVSRICLGGLGFGDAADWMLDEAATSEVVDRAIELGINFFDTANDYSDGRSEHILGRALADHDRDRLVLATKVYGQSVDGSGPGRLSRKVIEQELDGSRDRLGVDTIDLYQVHPGAGGISGHGVLGALDDAVRRGHVRYVGASTMLAYQLAEALAESDRRGLERFATLQSHYSLVHREVEREVLPCCRQRGVGVLPWSPLARGYLARPHEDRDATVRGERLTDRRQQVYEAGGGEEINRRVQEVAEHEGVSMAQVALAWLLHRDAVDAPVVGVTSVAQLEDVVEAAELRLSADDRSYLAEPYRPV